MTANPAPIALVEDWPTVLRRAFRRAGAFAETVDLAELLSSPEALAARGLTDALMRLATTTADRRRVAAAAAAGDLAGFRAAGHGDVGQDLRSGYRPSDRVGEVRLGTAWQIQLLKRYVDWRLTTRRAATVPADLESLDRRLLAVANATAPGEIHTLISDLGEIRSIQSARLDEYKAIGADLLAGNRDLARAAPGPAAGPGLPRRSWQPVPEAEDSDPAPAPDDTPPATPAS